MTRKDYILLACALRRSRPAEQYHKTSKLAYDLLTVQWQADCHYMAGVLAADNPRFQQQLFLDNCGVVKQETVS